MILDLIKYITERFGKNKETKDDIAFVLALGLAFGLACGLAVGLAFGLAFGLAGGLAFGLAFGLAIGLAFGLAFGLACGLADFIIELSKTNPTLSFFIILILAILIIAEVIFWKDKKQPKQNKSKFWFTVERKILSNLESAYLIGNLIGLYQIITKGTPILNDFLKQYGLSIMNTIGYGTAVVMVIYVYIYLNSLKYRNKRK